MRGRSRCGLVAGHAGGLGCSAGIGLGCLHVGSAVLRGLQLRGAVKQVGAGHEQGDECGQCPVEGVVAGHAAAPVEAAKLAAGWVRRSCAASSNAQARVCSSAAVRFMVTVA